MPTGEACRRQVHNSDGNHWRRSHWPNKSKLFLVPHGERHLSCYANTRAAERNGEPLTLAPAPARSGLYASNYREAFSRAGGCEERAAGPVAPQGAEGRPSRETGYRQLRQPAMR